MFSKPNLIPVMVATVATLSTSGAFAQNLQNWENNQTTQIQQDTATGVLNPQQAAGLQNREAQIQAQQQRYLIQNGGILTPQQQQKISSELLKVQGKVNKDARSNTQGLAPGYVPGYPAAYVPPVGYVTPSYVAPGYVPQNGQYQQHRHHHNWN